MLPILRWLKTLPHHLKQMERVASLGFSEMWRNPAKHQQDANESNDEGRTHEAIFKRPLSNSVQMIRVRQDNFIEFECVPGYVARCGDSLCCNTLRRFLLWFFLRRKGSTVRSQKYMVFLVKALVTCFTCWNLSRNDPSLENRFPGLNLGLGLLDAGVGADVDVLEGATVGGAGEVGTSSGSIAGVGVDDMREVVWR